MKMKKLALVIASIVLLANIGAAQQFDAATVKPNRSGELRSSVRNSAGRILMENVSLQKLILLANNIPDDRDNALSGPEWLSTERFDIQATFAPDTSVDKVRQMTQRLLTDRFKMVLHRVTTERKGYALVIAKNGPKIRPVKEDGRRSTSSDRGYLEAHEIAMTKLADLLTRMLGRSVLDETGLAGVFDFTLHWSPDETQRLASIQDPANAPDPGLSIFSALQEQLGLKLESRSQPDVILVVDHIEKTPTAN